MTDLHVIRDWRGVKQQLSHCTTDELMTMIGHAVRATDQISRFISDIQLELIEREEIPADPHAVV